MIIKVDNDHVHLHQGLRIPWDLTNLPKDSFSFRTHQDIFWNVQQLEYNERSKVLRVAVIDYDCKHVHLSSQFFSKGILRLDFEPLDWTRWERQLFFYQRIKLDPFISNPQNRRFDLDHPSPRAVATPTHTQVKRTNSFEQQPLSYTREVSFSIDFSEVTFLLGYIAFSRKIQEIGGLRVDFQIPNDHLLPEFENIKSWFPKKLRIKKFKVQASITMTMGKVSQTKASSLHIDMINTALIDSIQYQRTVALSSSPKLTATDQTVFTAKELVELMAAEDKESYIFNQEEQDILKLLSEHHRTRNRKQLEYLSGVRQSEKAKLRFTLRPSFGFLFFVEGAKRDHFVWELLNSNATYIWSFDRPGDMDGQYDKVQSFIHTIKQLGREEYKTTYGRNRDRESEVKFAVVGHNDINAENGKGFSRWKDKLEEKLD